MSYLSSPGAFRSPQSSLARALGRSVAQLSFQLAGRRTTPRGFAGRTGRKRNFKRRAFISRKGRKFNPSFGRNSRSSGFSVRESGGGNRAVGRYSGRRVRPGRSRFQRKRHMRFERGVQKIINSPINFYYTQQDRIMVNYGTTGSNTTNPDVCSYWFGLGYGTTGSSISPGSLTSIVGVDTTVGANPNYICPGHPTTYSSLTNYIYTAQGTTPGTPTPFDTKVSVESFYTKYEVHSTAMTKQVLDIYKVQARSDIPFIYGSGLTGQVSSGTAGFAQDPLNIIKNTSFSNVAAGGSASVLLQNHVMYTPYMNRLFCQKYKILKKFKKELMPNEQFNLYLKSSKGFDYTSDEVDGSANVNNAAAVSVQDSLFCKRKSVFYLLKITTPLLEGYTNSTQLGPAPISLNVYTKLGARLFLQPQYRTQSYITSQVGNVPGSLLYTTTGTVTDTADVENKVNT